ncbi:MAG: excinuclease ABC subunit UvrC [Deltaproteobacteria bacterium]|nr:excinuclease ABC subunit UvrC [Deltaproteobacteria bacterium]
MDELRQQAACLPLAPGVYLFRNARGKVLYVGKAAALRKRVQSYFSPGVKSAKVTALMRQVRQLEVMVTPAEIDALILENHLIKKYQPRYNVNLKDDKHYPYLRLDPGEEFPRLEMVRRRRADCALYFGPYPSTGALRETLRLLQRHFLLRRCRPSQFRNRVRPCLNYQLQLCLGPCCLPVDRERYRRQVDQVVMFLRGRGRQLLAGLKKEMQQLAAAQRFEEAARVRDTITALGKVLQGQEVDSGAADDLDFLGLAGDGEQGYALYLLQVRHGHVVGGRPFSFPDFPGSPAELLRGFLQRCYSREQPPPPVVLLPEKPAAAALLADWLAGLGGRRVRLQTPVRGRKAALLAMATDNARNFLGQQRQQTDDRRQLLLVLARKLGLPRPPAVIECLDISNTQGELPVAGLAVFVDGRPARSRGRRYRLDDIPGPDDYAMMAAVIRRRFGPGKEAADFPDLLMIDGGRGQLSVVSRTLAELGVELPVLAIAKGRDEQGRKSAAAGDSFFLAGRKNPLKLQPQSGVYLLLQQIRDEAHRQAVSYHRRRRRRSLTTSVLQEIPGIGPVRAARLLAAFSGLEGIRAASRAELEQCAFLDRRAAAAVHAYFHDGGR